MGEEMVRKAIAGELDEARDQHSGGVKDGAWLPSRLVPGSAMGYNPVMMLQIRKFFGEIAYFFNVLAKVPPGC